MKGQYELPPPTATYLLVYRTQVAQDMVWVWGENGPDATLESALTPAQLIPELEDKEAIKSGKVSLANVGQNDLAYGWDTFMENVVVSCGMASFSSLCVCAFVSLSLSILNIDLVNQWLAAMGDVL